MSLDFPTWQALLALQADYAAAVDSGDWDAWAGCFTAPDCLYTLQPRENHARGLPLATLRLESQGMLQDRAYGIRETLFHDPYYQRHVVGLPRVLGVAGEGEAWRLRTETNYAVFRTKPDGPSTVFNVGRYLDVIVRHHGGLKFAERLAVFDSEMIPNAIIDPI